MSIAARQPISFARYLEIEEESVIKHEYLDGTAWAMAGGTYEHSAVVTNVIVVLSNQLRGKGCRVYESNMRVRVKATGLATYPDASVVCGKIQLDSEDPKHTTAVNPRVLIEVLSPSTEKYDRSEKADHYKKIASLKELALVSTDTERVEVWRKSGSLWRRHEYREVAPLTSIGCELPMREIYRDLAGGAG